MDKDDEYPRVVRILPPDLIQEIEEEAERREAEERRARDLDETYKRAVIRLADSLEEAPETLPAKRDIDKSELALQRQALLTQWEAAGGHKRSHLYSLRCPNPQKPDSPVISKGQFYLWNKGQLSPRATATLRLEFFLRANT